MNDSDFIDYIHNIRRELNIIEEQILEERGI